MKPRVGNICGENNLAVTLADQVTRGLERPIEIIEAYLVVLLLFAHPNDIVTECHEGHMDGFDPPEQIRINRPRENESVNQAMLLKNRRQVDPIGRCSWRVMQRGEQHMLFQARGIGFDTLQDACMKGMEKIAVAQEKTNHFCAPLENPAGLRIGAKSQAPNSFKYARARFPAHLRAGIEHAGNRSYADGSGLGNLPNRRFPWNCFHSNTALCRFGTLAAFGVNPLARASLTHQNGDGIVNGNGLRDPALWQEVGKSIQSIGSMRFWLDRGFSVG